MYSIRVARFVMRRVLAAQERKRHEALKSALETAAKELARSKRNNFKSSALILNLGLFFLIAERDIQAVKIDALTHPDPWRRSLCARVILLTIHELDLDKAAGRLLQQALTDAGVPEDLRRELTQSLRGIRAAQQKAQQEFSFLRNSTIAHRDANALMQYRAITELDEREVIKTASQFYEATSSFLSTLAKALVEAGSLQGLINQEIARTKSEK
jgi:hypothetical protein